jgi:hypothetical protein
MTGLFWVELCSLAMRAHGPFGSVYNFGPSFKFQVILSFIILFKFFNAFYFNFEHLLIVVLSSVIICISQINLSGWCWCYFTESYDFDHWTPSLVIFGHQTLKTICFSYHSTVLQVGFAKAAPRGGGPHVSASSLSPSILSLLWPISRSSRT